MVKPPRIRHSKTRKDPVTIELEPGAVSRIADDATPDDAPQPEAIKEAEPAATSETLVESAVSETAVHKEDWLDFDRPEPEEEPEDKPTAEPAAAGGSFETRPESDRSKPQEEAAAMTDTPPTASRNEAKGGFSGLAAGIVGGIIALAGAGGLQFAGLLPAPGAGGGNSAAMSGLQAEVTTLREQLAGLSAGGGSADVESVRQALVESTDRVDDLTAGLDQAKSDLAGLKSAVESGGAGENAGLQALDAKISEIERSVAALGQNGAAAPVETTAINEKLATVEAAVTAATTAASATDGRLGTLEQGVAALQQDVTALTGKVDAQASQPKVALAIAVSALKAAVDAGGSFASEVEAFAAIAPDAPELAELRTLAEKGVPSQAEIAAEAPAATSAIIAAGRVVDENAGFFERLLSSAESLVKVRPVGPVEGTGVPETVARMEAALKDGDLARAIAEYDTLPAAPKAAGQAFAEKIRARLAAGQLVEKATAGALKAA